MPNRSNLDAVIAIGYRVNSKAATRFRIWTTNNLKEYITKDFVLNDEMLKNGKKFGKDYFDELLERIRISEQVNEEAIKKLQTSIKLYVPIMIKIVNKQSFFIRLFKTNSTLPLQVKQLQR